jgi:hypothetical protein
MPAPSYHDIPIRSHCIVVSLTTAEPRTNRDVGYWIRSSLMRSGKAFAVMAGPAGGDMPGRNEAYAIASAVAMLPEDQVPEPLRKLRADFLAATSKETPAHGI